MLSGLLIGILLEYSDEIVLTKEYVYINHGKSQNDNTWDGTEPKYHFTTDEFPLYPGMEYTGVFESCWKVMNSKNKIKKIKEVGK